MYIYIYLFSFQLNLGKIHENNKKKMYDLVLELMIILKSTIVSMFADASFSSFQR